MARQLTKKQRGFVKDYLATGNGSLSAKRNYDVANDDTARAIATENLTKPSIANAIADALSDELLTEKHLELLNKRDPVTGDVDTQAVKAALDMAYKIKGTYAPEKKIVGTFDINHEHRERAIKAIRSLTS